MRTTLNTDELTLTKCVWESKRRTKDRSTPINKIYEAAYNGTPCYCLEEVSTGNKMLFDMRKDVLHKMTRDTNRLGTIRVDMRPANGMCYFSMSKQRKGTPKQRVMMSQYLYGRYRGNYLREIRRDNSMIGHINLSDTVEDLRSSNIYKLSEPVEYTAERRIWRDGNYIYIHQFKNDVLDIVDYHPVLLALLQTPSICSYGIDQYKNGGAVRSGYTILASNKIHERLKLHTLVYLFFTKYQEYGDVNSFLAHLDKERDSLNADSHCIDHFTGDIHNQCMWNLWRMSIAGNSGKNRTTKMFKLPYKIYGAIDHRSGECLVEYNFHEIKHLYKCSLDSEDELVSFLNIKMGKTLITAKTKVSVIRQTDGVLHGCSVRTPKELSEATGENSVLRDFTLDYSHAMELLRLNAEQPEVFTPLVSIDKRGIPVGQLADMLSAYFGSTVEATVTPADQS